MTDASLVRRATKGDQRAFAAIFDRYHQEIYRFCLSILGNAEDAREALQNTMLKALQALPGEQREIRLKPWLYRVAHNEAIDLVRRRRETVAVDVELAAPGGLAETVAQRERLRQLLLDLADLPDRQRAALVMRELGGLGFEQIAEAFDTSPATARQTVYEARVNLRSLEEGRDMSCEEVMHRLSNADGRVNRRRDLNAHLRACPDCRAFREAIDTRRRDLAALAPLPVVASAGILHAILGSAQGAAGGATGAGGATVAASAGKAVSAGLVAKSAATIAVVAAIGVSAADRSGLIHTGLPGGSSDATPAAQTEQGAAGGAATPSGGQPAGGAGGTTASGAGKASGGHTNGEGASQRSASNGKGATGHGKSGQSQSPASQHGRETAEEHRNGGASHGQDHAHGHGGTSTAHGPSTSHHEHHGGHVKARGGSPPPHPQPTQPKAPEQPSIEATPQTEQPSGLDRKGAESQGGSEGMP